MDDRYDNFRIRPRSFDPPQQSRPAPLPPRPVAPAIPSQPHPASAQHTAAHHQQTAHQSPAHHTQTHPQPALEPETPVPQAVAVPQQAAQAPAATEHHHEPRSKKSKVKNRKKGGKAKKFFKFTTVLLIVVALLGTAGFVAYKYGKPLLEKNKDVAAAPMIENTNQPTAEQLSENLKKVIDLPQETPLLITIQDASVVQKNPFFAKAQTGDQVLYYQNSKVAVLYRPSSNKIINYSPQAEINTSQSSSQ